MPEREYCNSNRPTSILKYPSHHFKLHVVNKIIEFVFLSQLVCKSKLSVTRTHSNSQTATKEMTRISLLINRTNREMSANNKSNYMYA